MKDCQQFSSEYVKDIIAKVQDDDFAVILHNCGNTGNCTQAMVYTGAMGYHFGNKIDMVEALKEVPADALAMGNLDPGQRVQDGLGCTNEEGNNGPARSDKGLVRTLCCPADATPRPTLLLKILMLSIRRSMNLINPETKLPFDALQISDAELGEAMGYGTATPDENVSAEMHTLLRRVASVTVPRFEFVIEEGTLCLEDDTLHIGGRTLHVGRIIARQLRGAEQYAPLHGKRRHGV